MKTTIAQFNSILEEAKKELNYRNKESKQRNITFAFGKYNIMVINSDCHANFVFDVFINDKKLNLQKKYAYSHNTKKEVLAFLFSK